MDETSDVEHERRVEEFMKRARARDPERVAELERTYQVLTEAELDWRRSKEVRLLDEAA